MEGRGSLLIRHGLLYRHYTVHYPIQQTASNIYTAPHSVHRIIAPHQLPSVPTKPSTYSQGGLPRMSNRCHYYETDISSSFALSTFQYNWM